jgi:hypothetical protein
MCNQLMNVVTEWLQIRIYIPEIPAMVIARKVGHYDPYEHNQWFYEYPSGSLE